MANYYKDNNDIEFYLKNYDLSELVSLYENNYKEEKEYDFAPDSYEEAIQNYDLALDVAGKIAGDVIAENADSVDEEGVQFNRGTVTYAKGTQINLEMITKSGLNGVTLPRKYEGLNFPVTIYAMMVEIVSRADGSFMNLFGLQDIGETISEYGSEEQKKKYCTMFAKGEVTGAMILTEPDAGSDLQSVRTKAVWDEKDQCYRIYGVKRFITNGNAEVSLILARSEEHTTDARGLSMFIIEKDDTIKIRRIEDKLGIHGSPTCELEYHGTKAELVGKKGLGLIKYVMALMNGARLGVAAQALGISEEAYREAYAYANEREQFGKTIINFTMVRRMLDDMKMELDAMRALLYNTSLSIDHKKMYNKEYEKTGDKDIRNLAKKYEKRSGFLTALSKFYLTEMGNKICYDAVQIHGGTGYMRDFKVQRLSRDIRITSIYEGTTQLQVVAAIGSITSGRFFDLLIDELENAERGIVGELNELKVFVNDYEELIKQLKEEKNAGRKDYYEYDLVEIASILLISAYLLKNAKYSEDKVKIAERYIHERLPKVRYLMDRIMQ
ncbi:acyl-CoA dehydrogenase [candidate division TA06 bacterium]|uniref:Acyl-CoA dehydrogenase n=1 Tax=candidate division TA06 bacterium TaxID=2250710 RepID=A0A660SQ12_UNCT6|nr:MAG: acyl-CoA dehydrogenase [candidate division TA06 bacterium]